MEDEKHIKQKDADKFAVIGTKTSPQFAELFHRICRRKGLNTYQAIQMMVDAFVRYADDRHNLSQDLELLMNLFEHMIGWKDAFNLADATAEKDIQEAVYFLTAKKKKGVRAVMVCRPFFGQWSETFNVQKIFERMVELLMPERYRRLRSLAIDWQCNSLLELMDRLVDEHSKDSDVKAYREEFEDANRSEWGKKPAEQPYRRKHHNDPDMFAIQEERRRKTAERKAEEARRWLEDHSDIRPHGSEW